MSLVRVSGPHKLADKDSKRIPKRPLLPRKNSWVFSRRDECDSIQKTRQMFFQVSGKRGNHFLDLTDNNNHILTPSYAKGGTWLRHMGESPSLCAHLTRLITNHASIGEYYFCFFPNKNPSCPCKANIETGSHTLFECGLYNNGNAVLYLSVQDTINFLKDNPEALKASKTLSHSSCLSSHLLITSFSFTISPL